MDNLEDTKIDSQRSRGLIEHGDELKSLEIILKSFEIVQAGLAVVLLPDQVRIAIDDCDH